MDLVGRAGEFLNKVFEPAATELGQLLGVRMRYWQFKNAVNVMEKAQKLVTDKGLRPEQLRALGFGDAIRLLEGASKEEDETVQELWARLMANAVDPRQAVRPEKMFVEILKSLAGREVVFLDLMMEIDAEIRVMMTVAEYAAAEQKLLQAANAGWRKFPKEERNAAIQNLIRLRCVTLRKRDVNLNWMFEEVPAARGPTKWSVVDAKKLSKTLGLLADEQVIASGVMDYEAAASRRNPGRASLLPEGRTWPGPDVCLLFGDRAQSVRPSR
ncbi:MULTISPECIES: Abi-alpha family protein [Bradyrhizobium]|uniref:Abi-alpha family protein n=1 Tax=Bradyrhizobium pachyrhizi TaxID=280333 RepID=UPI000481B6D6